MVILLVNILRPFRVRILLRNPCLLFWIRRLAPDMVGRGPHRIWVPAIAGFAEIDAFATRSSVCDTSVCATVGAGAESRVWEGNRKMLLAVAVLRVVGRRVGRWEKERVAAAVQRGAASTGRSAALKRRDGIFVGGREAGFWTGSLN